MRSVVGIDLSLSPVALIVSLTNTESFHIERVDLIFEWLGLIHAQILAHLCYLYNVGLVIGVYYLELKSFILPILDLHRSFFVRSRNAKENLALPVNHFPEFINVSVRCEVS